MTAAGKHSRRACWCLPPGTWRVFLALSVGGAHGVDATEETMPAQVIRVADYGAKADDGRDAVPAIREALAAAKRLHGAPAVIQFEPGRYLCAGTGGKTSRPASAVCIGMDAFTNLTVDGQGATLVGQELAQLLVARNSHSITVRNLIVDWEPLPHTAGYVVGLLKDEQAFDLAPKIPAHPPAGRIVQGILAYNPDGHRLADSGWEVYQTQGERDANPTELTPDGNLRIFQRRGTQLPEVDTAVIVRHQVYGINAFTFQNCSDALLENITVHAVPGMAVVCQQSRDVTIRRMRVVPSAGGWMSATADAMHFNCCRGQITVEDSEFCGMGDDAINIHAMYGLVTARVDAHTLEVGRGRMHSYYDKVRAIWDAPLPEDRLEYSGGDEPLLAQGELRVVRARQDLAKQRTVIQFADPLPAAVTNGTVLSNLSATPSVRIRRCHVHGNRARGMLLQTRDVVLEDCVFEDVSGAGAQICTDAADWWESLGSRDVTVQRCTFRRCNFGVARRAAALDIFSDLAKGRQSAAGVHQRLHLLDNTFDENSGAAIHVGSADGVDVRSNRFLNATNSLVTIVNSRNVSVTGNRATGANAGVMIQGSSDRTTIKVERNTGFTQLSP